LINNYHYLRGGSECAYFDMAKILEKNGHEVAFFSTKNQKNLPSQWEKYFVYAPDFTDPSIGWLEKIKIAFRLFYNFEAKRNLEKLLKEFKPDVSHLHNIYHHLSPSIIGVLKKNKISTVMTLHDYKLISPSYNLFVRGKIWEASQPDKYWRCFTDRCINNSYVKSLVGALESYLHHWFSVYEKIDAFISPSHFLIEKFREFGFKKEITFLPNPVFAEEMKGEPAGGEKYILYYGRLSAEKGIGDLLKAYQNINTDVTLKIIGEGPLKVELKKQAAELSDKIIFTGRLEGENLWREIKGAEFIVAPSLWYENAPYSVIESLALGKIVLAAKIGGLAELVRDGENGFLFAAGNADDLKERMEYILAHPELKGVIGPKAIASTKLNSPEEYYRGLMAYYKKIHE
jgi:glycosyltransferase involved in cell wall biosynthesis